MTPCPPRHILSALSDPDFPPDEALAILRHTSECDACKQTLAELSSPSETLDRMFRGLPAPAPVVAPPPAGRGRWSVVVVIAAAAAVGATAALGTQVARSRAAAREANAAAALADRRATLATQLAEGEGAFARGFALLDDGEPAGAPEVARAATLARAVADDATTDPPTKAAALALLARAEPHLNGLLPPPPRPNHPGYTPRLAVLTLDRTRLLTVADEARVVVWDAETGGAVAACLPKEGVAGRFESVAVSPCGRYVAAGGGDGRVWVWDFPPKGEVRPAAQVLGGPARGPVWAVGFTPVAGPGAVPDLWVVGAERVPRNVRFIPGLADRPAGRPPASLDRPAGAGPRVGPVRHGRPVLGAGADPEGKVAVTTDPDATFRFWDVATRQPAGPPARPPR
jgi:hypothetical protein